MSHESGIHVEAHSKPKTISTAGTSPRAPRPTGPTPGRVRCFWCDRIHSGPHPLAVCAVCRASYATLRSLDMRGSYALSDRTIDAVMKRAAPGNFALGYMEGDHFSVFFVGRSDSDVRASLHEWVGIPSARETFASNAKAPWATRARGAFPMAAPMPGHVGNGDSSYTHFAYSYAASPAEALEKELRNFDDFGGLRALDNARPPLALV